MDTDETVERISAKRPEISREQILNRLENERKKTNGLISDAVLLNMIAAEFGCELSNNKAIMPSLLAKDLLPGMSDAIVTGRILAVFPPKSFDGAKKGKIASLLICDASGILRVVLWNEKADLIQNDKLRVGKCVRFLHGYTKQDASGKIELHVSERSEIESDPPDVRDHDFPDISKFSVKIAQIPTIRGDRRAIFTGVVNKLFAVSTFEREDLSKGKVMRLILEDRTGTIAVVVWNEKADELEKTLKIGDRIHVVNGKIKKGMGEQLEVNVDAGTYLGSILESENYCEIIDLKNGMNVANVQGIVVADPSVREVKTSRGEIVKLATFELKDETGIVNVSAWRRNADDASSLKQGDRLLIKNGYVKKAFRGDRLEITTRDNTSILTHE